MAGEATPAPTSVNRAMLLTDLYQLTMMQSYLEHGLTEQASFEFFVRRLPKHRNFLVAAGLEQALDYLQGLSLSDEELSWLSECGRFSRSFVDYLATFEFTGDVHAMAEGTILFADEPILRVTAPLPMAQLVETRLINILHFQTLIASKAARMALAAPGRLLVDFGLRRTHEAEAGLMAARAGFIGGMSGTSNVLAGAKWNIPLYGTMAHSFVQAHDSERDAFIHFAHSHPDNNVPLIDTYDTEAGARVVTEIAPQLEKEGIPIQAVRIDSGDLGAHARKVRAILDEAGLTETHIFASGNLDEYMLQRLAKEAAPIDGYGVGTRLDTSSDAPYLDCAYKLEEYAGQPRRKRSEGKATWPGRKQVYRRFEDEMMVEDILTTEEDAVQGEPLIRPVMVKGRPLSPHPELAEIRQRTAAGLARLPKPLHSLDAAEAPYPVTVSGALTRLAKDVDARTGA